MLEQEYGFTLRKFYRQRERTMVDVSLTTIFAPDVKHEYRCNEKQAHNQDRHGTTAAETRKHTHTHINKVFNYYTQYATQRKNGKRAENIRGYLQQQNKTQRLGKSAFISNPSNEGNTYSLMSSIALCCFLMNLSDDYSYCWQWPRKKL